MGRTVTASIGPHYEDFIRNSILSGRYNNASEVIREGLRRLEEDEARLVALRAALEEAYHPKATSLLASVSTLTPATRSTTANS